MVFDASAVRACDAVNGKTQLCKWFNAWQTCLPAHLRFGQQGSNGAATKLRQTCAQLFAEQCSLGESYALRVQFVDNLRVSVVRRALDADAPRNPLNGFIFRVIVLPTIDHFTVAAAGIGDKWHHSYSALVSAVDAHATTDIAVNVPGSLLQFGSNSVAAVLAAAWYSAATLDSTSIVDAGGGAMSISASMVGVVGLPGDFSGGNVAFDMGTFCQQFAIAHHDGSLGGMPVPYMTAGALSSNALPYSLPWNALVNCVKHLGRMLDVCQKLPGVTEDEVWLNITTRVQPSSYLAGIDSGLLRCLLDVARRPVPDDVAVAVRSLPAYQTRLLRLWSTGVHDCAWTNLFCLSLYLDNDPDAALQPVGPDSNLYSVYAADQLKALGLACDRKVTLVQAAAVLASHRASELFREAVPPHVFLSAAPLLQLSPSVTASLSVALEWADARTPNGISVDAAGLALDAANVVAVWGRSPHLPVPEDKRVDVRVGRQTKRQREVASAAGGRPAELSPTILEFEGNVAKKLRLASPAHMHAAIDIVQAPAASLDEISASQIVAACHTPSPAHSSH